MIVRLLLVLAASALVAAHGSRLDDNEDESVYLVGAAGGYRGVVHENDTLVEVTPVIRANGPVCSFRFLPDHHHHEAPFEVRLMNDNEALVRVVGALDCERRRSYKLSIVAESCSGSVSAPATLHVQVADVNEFAPEWSQGAYSVTAEPGRLYEELVRVSATDRDCTPKYGDVCKYEILTPDQPFAIDNDGVIRNTESLEWERAHTHSLAVVAYDCGMRQSAPVTVTVRVSKPCAPTWRGVAERVEYPAGSGALALFPDARLHACRSTARCPALTRVTARVTLTAAAAPRACDRDTYSVTAQRSLCGVNSRAAELLPRPGPGAEWTRVLKPDAADADWERFELDGESAASVPPGVLPHQLSSKFTMMTWLRHAPSPDNDPHRKEHVLCLADDHKMNRHHYALFVRNCRLILLLRRELSEGELNIFRPAEWRWKLPEVCDNQWHHYALNIRFPSVQLFVDGKPYRDPDTDSDQPEVIDDWPLHPAQGVNTTLGVGACWQGSEARWRHGLRGALAGLAVLLHDTVPTHELACVAACREGLSLAPDLYLSAVAVEGDGVEEVETLLRRVAYGDSRAAPTPGRRNVHIDTTVTCDNGRVEHGQPVDAYIMVSGASSPAVLVNGSGDASRDYAHFRAGLPVFHDLTLRLADPAPVRHQHEEDNSVSHQEGEGEGLLDSCVVSVYPALNPDHEALALAPGAHEGALRAAVNRDGAVLSGAAPVPQYQALLRRLTYTNKKPAYYLNRVFKLSCSARGGRFSSNEYVQTLTVVHPHMSASTGAVVGGGMADKLAVPRAELDAIPAVHARVFAAHVQRDSHHAELPAAHTRDIPHQPSAAHSNHVALLIGVVMAGAAVLAAGVAVARARSPRRRRRARLAVPTTAAPRQPDNELAWDDSALTITVNPMDETGGTVGSANVSRATPGAVTLDSSDAESASDSESDRHDSDSEDEHGVGGVGVGTGAHKYRNVSQLEWDNTTM